MMIDVALRPATHEDKPARISNAKTTTAVHDRIFKIRRVVFDRLI